MSATRRPATDAAHCEERRRLRSSILTANLVLTAGFQVALVSCDAGRTDGALRGSAPRYWSLVRLAEKDAPAAPPVELRTETIGGDSRTAFLLRPGERLELGPIETTGECRLRFGLGSAGAAAVADGDGPTLRLAIRRGTVETPLPSEHGEPLRAGSASWSDREIGIPRLPAGSWSLVGELPGESRKDGESALLWSSPYLVCDRGVPAPPPAGRPDVILISIDTLRPDHLGLYGYDRDTSPVLDRFAERSLVFESAFAPAPYTLPSHATMLTGLPPSVHRAGHEHQNHPVDPKVPTLAEHLRAAGYRTQAFTGGGLISKSTGLDRGFDEWTERWRLRQRASLGSVLPEVFDALGTADGVPQFLFLHTFDVHGPYQQPAPDRVFRGESYSAPLALGDWRLITAAPHHAYHQLERFSGFADVLGAYDSGIRLVDRRLGEFFAFLERSGRFDRSLIIVTSDHGESLFEHRRYVSHGHTLHDVELRTPLLVKPPGEAHPRRIRDLVGLIDIVPTVLEVAGLPVPPGLDGRSLLAPAAAKSDRRMLGESGITGARFVRTPSWKVITPTGAYWNRRRFDLFGTAADRFETGWQVYDLVHDPQETWNLAVETSRTGGELTELVALLRATDPPGRLADNVVAIDDELMESLRALGYVQ